VKLNKAKPGRHRKRPAARSRVTRLLRAFSTASATIAVAMAGYGAVGGASASAATTATGVTWHRLTLINGWQSGASAGTGNPRWAVKGGVVYLSGSVHQVSGTKQDLAKLPLAARPSRRLYITVYTSGSTTGWLTIYPSGLVAAHSASGTAREYTSLASVSFPAASTAAHKLGLLFGWESSQKARATGDPGYNVSGGVVYLSGSVHQSSGTDQIFTFLPKAARPAHIMYLAMYTDAGTTGELVIDPDGAIQARGTQARSFTSLAGVSYPTAKITRHKLALLPGWTPDHGATLTGDPSYSLVGGVVYLSGAMVQSMGSGNEFAVLPKSARPAHTLYIKAWMGAFAVGTVLINPDGTMSAYTSSSGPNEVSLETISFPVTS
jgi:hypothetical protein